ncbi:hypothetical protein [Variovorax sp. GB1P17]|uniref:hypothetical protein n=1 Tax=Variovorax sp. GB1P17 TaxID=3443740 RepID=UPI003F4904E2
MSKAASPTSSPARAPVTSKTRFVEGGERSAYMARECTYNIEPLADMLIRLAEDQKMATNLEDAPPPAVLRMLGCRIKELNSVLMSYLSDDGITMDDAHAVLFRDATHFEDEVDHG